MQSHFRGKLLASFLLLVLFEAVVQSRERHGSKKKPFHHQPRHVSDDGPKARGGNGDFTNRILLPKKIGNEQESFSLALLTPNDPFGTLSSGQVSKGSHRSNHEEDQVKYPKLFFSLRASNNTKHHHHQRSKNHHHHEGRGLTWGRSKKTRRHHKSSQNHYNAFHSHHRHYTQQLQREKEPTFDESYPSIVTAQLGSHAFLSCRIHDLDDKSVSWIRNKDAHILTVDRYTFISDKRFVSWFDPEQETWTLQVKFTTPEDAGQYECQISTEPKKSHFVTLSVVVPVVVILGQSELHVRSGSDVVLKCLISKALITPPYVFWYHDDKRVPEARNSLGPVHQAPLEKKTKNSSVASLTINNVDQHHAGNYTCAPAGLTTSASVLLHVLNGEHPAAMQHGSSGVRPLSVMSSISFFCFVIHLHCKFKFWIIT